MPTVDADMIYGGGLGPQSVSFTPEGAGAWLTQRCPGYKVIPQEKSWTPTLLLPSQWASLAGHTLHVVTCRGWRSKHFLITHWKHTALSPRLCPRCLLCLLILICTLSLSETIIMSITAILSSVSPSRESVDLRILGDPPNTPHQRVSDEERWGFRVEKEIWTEFKFCIHFPSDLREIMWPLNIFWDLSKMLY